MTREQNEPVARRHARSPPQPLRRIPPPTPRAERRIVLSSSDLETLEVTFHGQA